MDSTTPRRKMCCPNIQSMHSIHDATTQFLTSFYFNTNPVGKKKYNFISLRREI